MTSVALRSAFILVTATLRLTGPAVAGWNTSDWANLVDAHSHMLGIVSSPSGMGGMLIAAVRQDPSPGRIIVTRMDHSGTEVRGDSGGWIPIVIDDLWNN